jgi:enediyne polyketide synthase
VLLGPYVERRVQELVSGSAVGVAIEGGAAERRLRSDRAIRRAMGEESSVLRRSDGKPWVADGLDVSAAHCSDLTFAVAGSESVGCDIEAVISRDDTLWQGLLGTDRLSLARVIARESGEEKAAAATRVWAASECLKKAGTMVDAPLVLDSTTADGWVLLSSGPLVTATLVATLRGSQERIVLAVLTKVGDSRE